jgi:glutamyl-Q tRNA(Asp) synthetase
MLAAIGSWCDARARGDLWQLRIDDLDPPRVAPGATDDILHCLEAFALAWDGDVIYQSRRSDAYHAALHRLRDQGHVFPCACSRREIAEGGVAGIDGAVYPGTCRRGLPPGRAARALRLRVASTTIVFDDELQGRIEQALETQVGDFVLYRADHVYSYHLACVVDDAEQGVTRVVRGADLLDSTPRQIYLQRLLGLPEPDYLHLPVVVDAAGNKLSKQTLARPVDGSAPSTVIREVLALLGQQPPADLAGAGAAEALSWAAAHWRRDRLPQAGAVPRAAPAA